jgi:hypothetical protein
MPSKLTHTPDGQCNICCAVAEKRTCGTCGLTLWILDCGHMHQPTPICADGNGQLVCDDCYEGSEYEITEEDYEANR